MGYENNSVGLTDSLIEFWIFSTKELTNQVTDRLPGERKPICLRLIGHYCLNFKPWL